MPCATLQLAEGSFASAAPCWPRTSCCDARTRSTAPRTSAPIAAYWPLKSNWLTDSVAAIDGTDEVMFVRLVVSIYDSCGDVDVVPSYPSWPWSAFFARLRDSVLSPGISRTLGRMGLIERRILSRRIPKFRESTQTRI